MPQFLILYLSQKIMYMKKLKLSAFFIAALFIATSSHAADDMSMNFVKTAANAGEFEIESSQLALERSKNEDVRKFAQMMIDDHSRAGAELKNAATTQQLKAQVSNLLNDKDKATMNELKSVDASKFDIEYLKVQQQAHIDAVNLFTAYSQKGSDKTLKAFAEKTLPTLQKHLQHVLDIAAKNNLTL